MQIKKVSVEETKDLSSNLLSSGFFVIKNTLVGGEDDVSELSWWKNLGEELFEVLELEIESWWDDTALVQSSVEVNNDFAVSGIIDDLEFVDVSMLLHLSEELDDDLWNWSEENLHKKLGGEEKIKMKIHFLPAIRTKNKHFLNSEEGLFHINKMQCSESKSFWNFLHSINMKNYSFSEAIFLNQKCSFFMRLYWQRVRKIWRDNIYLSFARFFSVNHLLETVIQYGHLDHFW